MPRFWVLTDYDRGEVVLVIRGTMSLNEIAVDLTCDPEVFQPAETSPTEEDETPVPGQFAFPTFSEKEATEGDDARASVPKYHVHGGMARLAKAMGSVGKPVHLAVMEALHSHPDFGEISRGTWCHLDLTFVGRSYYMWSQSRRRGGGDLGPGASCLSLYGIPA